MKAARMLQGLIAVSISIACAHAEDVGICHDIDNDAARLKCYDRKSGYKKLATESILSERWGYDRPAKLSRYQIMQHDANYAIFRQTDSVNLEPRSPTHQPPSDQNSDPASIPHIDHAEIKFQLSAKVRVWDSGDDPIEHKLGLWLAYSQQSHWQILNAPNSRPFRETNYQPEAILAIRPPKEDSVEGFKWQTMNIGVMHHSNGQSDPVSRSWNRVYAEFGFDRRVLGGDLAVVLRPWYRLKEQPLKDDNPDITDFYGHGDIKMLYRNDCCTLSLMARGNLRTGKGAGQIDFGFPLYPGLPAADAYPLKWYFQLFSGYGESLIDYNRRQTTFGLGVMVNDRR
jgi:phospholipase A1